VPEEREMTDAAEVTEEMLMHLRLQYGSWTAKMPLPMHERYFQIVIGRYPLDFFTGTWIAFADSLPEPTQYGDGPEGRDALEIVAVLAFTQSLPPLTRDLIWLGLDHQYAGTDCCHIEFVATRLNVRAEVYPLLRKIARDRWPSGLHDQITTDYAWTKEPLRADYRRDLKALGLSCETVVNFFAEALYPIDATQENLDRIAENPPRISDLISSNEQSRWGANLVIFILTANSD
jgi:hypothetical protein